MLVACLCAEWCVACREYRPVFDALAARFAGRAEFAWIDIEDDSDALGDPEIEDFPTLLLAEVDTDADAEAALFFGPVTPQPQTAERLIGSGLAGGLQPLPAAAPGARIAPAVVRLARARRAA